MTMRVVHVVLQHQLDLQRVVVQRTGAHGGAGGARHAQHQRRVTGRGSVEDHAVVFRIGYQVVELAEAHQLFEAGRRFGEVFERGAVEKPVVETGQHHRAMHVLFQRRAAVDAAQVEVRFDLRRSIRCHHAELRVTQIGLLLHHQQRSSTRARRLRRQRRCNGALADAAFAGDEEQLLSQQRVRGYVLRISTCTTRV